MMGTIERPHSLLVNNSFVVYTQIYSKGLDVISSWCKFLPVQCMCATHTQKPERQCQQRVFFFFKPAIGNTIAPIFFFFFNTIIYFVFFFGLFWLVGKEWCQLPGSGKKTKIPVDKKIKRQNVYFSWKRKRKRKKEKKTIFGEKLFITLV